MTRAVLLSCWPWLAVLLALFVGLRLTVRLNGARPDLSRLRTLHRDEQGSVQTLSFVLTVPVFVMILMLIVQVSQIMIGTIVVHYAAFATARSAVVWIPAYLNEAERENCLSLYIVDPDTSDQSPPLDPSNPDYGLVFEGGMTYRILPGGLKYEKITSAAALACLPICPSRNVGLSLNSQGLAAAQLLTKAYLTMVPGATNNPRIPRRLQNKLAYALNHTAVKMRFYHPNSEPPLVPYFLFDSSISSDDPEEFRFNELGWQDVLTVDVTHQMALLPGPGRLLARRVSHPGGSPDELSEKVGKAGSVYVYPLTASATMGLEGEKSVIRYVYRAY